MAKDKKDLSEHTRVQFNTAGDDSHTPSICPFPRITCEQATETEHCFIHNKPIEMKGGMVFALLAHLYCFPEIKHTANCPCARKNDLAPKLRTFLEIEYC